MIDDESLPRLGQVAVTVISFAATIAAMAWALARRTSYRHERIRP